MRALARRLGPRLPVLTASLQIAVGVVALALRAPIEPEAHPTHEIPAETSCH
jgi:hypothetical protein